MKLLLRQKPHGRHKFTAFHVRSNIVADAPDHGERKNLGSIPCSIPGLKMYNR